MKKREAFISLKDHKENFENNPKCRLINPAKKRLRKNQQTNFGQSKHSLKDNFKCKPINGETRKT